MDKMSEALPETIWHYTNWAGLDGMLRSRQLWASHVAYLDDTYELIQARKMLFSVLSARIQNALLFSWENDAKSILEQVSALNVCVASFSTDGDDLSQWRGYASPPPGFAIGFDFAKLRQAAIKNKCRLVACEYDKRVQRERIGVIVNRFLDQVKKQPNDENHGKRVNSLKWKLMQEFAILAPELKNGRFSAEKEWRLITESIEKPSHIDFHQSKSLVVPHFNFPILVGKDSALTAVRIGPNAHMALMERSIKTLLASREFTHASVFRSKVPFRNW